MNMPWVEAVTQWIKSKKGTDDGAEVEISKTKIPDEDDSQEGHRIDDQQVLDHRREKAETTEQ